MVYVIQIPKNADNFEQSVKIYFQKIGYKVTRGITWSRKNGFDPNGVPDFYVQSPNKKYWVEAKDFNDGLRVNQIMWLSKYMKETVYVAVPPETPNKYWAEEFPIVFEQKSLHSIEELINEKNRLEREKNRLEQEINQITNETQLILNGLKELIKIHPFNLKNGKFKQINRRLYYIEDEKYQNAVFKKYMEFRNKYLWRIVDTSEMGMSMAKKTENEDTSKIHVVEDVHKA